MASTWKKMAAAAHQDETLFLSHARQMTRLPVSNGHVAQYNYYHNLGSIQRSQFNRQAYKLQNDHQKSTNIRLPTKTSAYNNNNNNNNINNNISKTSESDLNGDFDHHHHRHVTDLTDDNNNNNNNNDNNNNNNSNNNHDEAINSNRADVSSDLSGSEKSTPPTSPVNADWRTATSGIVNGRSFAAVVASSPVSMVTEGGKIDISDDVDDGFEEESSMSHNNSNNNNNNDNDNNNNAIDAAIDKSRDGSTSSGLGNSVKVSTSSSESGDGKIESETAGTTVVKNSPQVIREIPERFKKLLKAAQDKAMAQRLRVEGVPLIRGYPQPSAAGYIYPQTIPSESYGCLVRPSYPQVVPVTQTMYPQSPAYAETNGFIDPNDQKSSQNPLQDIDQLDNQINNVPSPQQNGDGYGNSIPAEQQHLYINQGNIHCLPVQTAYSPLAYYSAHQYQMVYGVVNGNNDASCCYGYNASGIYVDQQQQQQALYYQQQQQQQQQHLYQQQSLYQNQQQQELYVSQLQQQQPQPFYDQMVAH